MSSVFSIYIYLYIFFLPKINSKGQGSARKKGATLSFNP